MNSASKTDGSNLLKVKIINNDDMSKQLVVVVVENGDERKEPLCTETEDGRIYVKCLKCGKWL